MTTFARSPNVSDEVPRDFNAGVEYVDRPVEEGHGERVAFICGDESISYTKLQRAVNRFGNAIQSLGVQMEQRVAILLPNRPEFVVALYGAMKAGAVATPLSWAVPATEQLALIADSRARALVTSEALWAPLRQRRGQLPWLRRVILVDGPDDPSAGQHHFETLVGSASPDLEPAPTTRDDMALWLHTSGSTGTPKWAMHRHADLPFAEVRYGRAVLDLRPGDVVFSGSPLFHAYPLAILSYFPMRGGATALLSTERTTPAHVFAMIKRHRVTAFAGVPTLFAQMLHAADREDVDLSSLRVAVSAAEALPAEIFHRFKERFGIEILETIGSTELIHGFISNLPGAIKPGSSGRVLPGYEVRILDDEGAPVPVGGIGHLWVKGGSLFAGYWNRADVTQRVLKGEWYSSGDMYSRDDDDFYWYQGRSDDMLRVSGHWVSPAAVEATLIQHPAVLEAAVVGKLDADQLMKPKAFVILRDPAAASDQLVEDLKNHIKTSMAPYSYPRWIDFVPELPKTATGKIQRFKLRE